VQRTEDKNGIMKDNEVIAGHLSPCVRIFIESLLNGGSTTSFSENTGGTDISRDIKEHPDRPSGLKRKILG
jgi:hypothetical protein